MLTVYFFSRSGLILCYPSYLLFLQFQVEDAENKLDLVGVLVIRGDDSNTNTYLHRLLPELRGDHGSGNTLQ